MTLEHARLQIADIVERWQSLSPADVRQYNEENTKNIFIQPLFEALGWDFHDINEVTAEQPAARGRVDFAFRVNGVSRFYLEAKPLRDELSSNSEWVKQAVGYAYGKGIPWVILTNFKELWGFTGDGDRRFITLNADGFTATIERLWLLSKESVASGYLERGLAVEGVIPPRIPVEQRLYSQLRDWRETLFNEINQYNRNLSLDAVDETIQKLFNRLIFIRTAEDRGIEERRLLSALRQYGNRTLRRSLLREVRSIFDYYDQHYDSDLFATHLLDSASNQAYIEDPTLQEIIQGLYEVPSGLVSYDFGAIDADILGAVYEQYLGHVTQIVRRRAEEIQLRMELGNTEQQASEEVAQVIARPVGRRKQGIYYTPKWVTDYIVGETVGKFIQENAETPQSIHNVKILDMSCGSGSFLIRAYDELLRWHSEGFDRAEDDIDPHERTAILRSNIYGVDLDPQAVEVARLNLMLRAMARRENLPSLADNLKTGNSLIDGDAEELKVYFGEDWEGKQPFDWEREYEPIMKDSGFDIIIGNPPYVRIQSIGRPEAKFYRKNYESAYGSFDLYVIFIERALKLLKPGGRLGFITSGKFLKNAYGKKIQEILKNNTTIEQVVDLSAMQVFPDATTYPIIIVFRKGVEEHDIAYTAVEQQADSETQPPDLGVATVIPAKQDAITEGIWPPPMPENRRLIDKLESMSDRLGRVSSNIFTGIQTSADRIYHLQELGKPHNGKVRVFSRSLDNELELEVALLKPLLSGKHIQRYVATPDGELLLFPYHVDDSKATLIPSNVFADCYPLNWEYLTANKDSLEGRERGRMRHDRWYSYVYPKNLALNRLRKLAIPRLVQNLKVAYDTDGKFYLDNVDVGGVLLRDDGEDNYLYVLALLNSKLIDWHFRKISVPFRGNFRSANRQFIEPLPIRRIESSNTADSEVHRAIVEKARRMLKLQGRVGPVRDMFTNRRTDLLHEIARVDSDIDDLVYELYGLTSAERRLVESEGTR